jgi:hypothetical protein
MINYIKNKLFGNIDSNNLLNKLVIILTFSIALIIIVFVFYFFRFSNGYIIPSGSQEVWGQFGDFVGGTLNPLLSFFGLIALLVTIALQSKELELSREELKLTRDELKKSADAQNEIKKTQIKQQFENTFFALLNQHNQILEKLPTDDILQKVVPRRDVGLTSSLSEVINSKFKGEYKLHGHYFRVLYQLLKFIVLNVPGSTIQSLDKNTKPFIPSTDEKMYSNMVRAFLSSDVFLLLAINCYCSKEDDDIYWGYKWLVEHYAFFEHLPLDETQLLSEIKQYYDKSAFGNNESLLP